MEKADFLQMLVRDPLRDVIVSGFIDSETPRMFHPLYERLYFVFDEIKVQMQLGDDAKISFREVGVVQQWIDLDEDDLFSAMSLYSVVFRTEQAVQIRSAQCADDALAVLDVTFFDGAGDRCVTFDPRNFFGFSIRS